MRIRSIDAFQIFDSRGNPTLEAVVRLEDGSVGHGLVPSGASTGQFEALELRDGDASKFGGRSVFRAIENVRTIIAPALLGADASDQAGIDRRLIELDGTPNKSRLGANAILGVSMATASAAARARGVPLFRHLGRGTLLPLPEIQLIGGGAHANWRTDVQDYLLIAVGATSYAQTLEMTCNVYRAAGELLARQNLRFGVADEGGYWPQFDSNEAPLELAVRAIEAAGYAPGREVALSLDIAASDLYDEQTNRYRFDLDRQSLTSEQLAKMLDQWCQRYPIISIEDPMADVDLDGWHIIAQMLRDRIQLVGDDLFVTNLERIRMGIEQKLANSVLIKLNQVGTVTETMQAIRLAQSSGMLPIVSARSGETEDAFISHLAVATDAGQLKVGSFARGERMAKWNEVLRIARELGDVASFRGAAIFTDAGLKPP
ncbi:phosphopyruvate hydratase [Fontivita pretiosa]|uniref:phosphopyruvate hydratase n=1 Tax=Fontivita pretiosa TaxID=2989684 RepID=UPI003D17D7B7